MKLKSLSASVVLLVFVACSGKSQPTIKLSNVPITTAIDQFARVAELNYMVDPNLFRPSGGSAGQATREPSISLLWTNTSAMDALSRLLRENGLVMKKDDFTTVILITDTNHVAKAVDASLLVSTNIPSTLTNGLIPRLFFADVPLDIALRQLAELGKINVSLDPKISDFFDPADHTFHNAPMVSLRWSNLTPRQAIIALCQIYDLLPVRDATTGLVTIKSRKNP